MRKSYRFRDASLVFAGTLLSNIIVLFVVSIIIYLISTNFGYTMSELNQNQWLIYLNSFLCELGFFLLFIIYNKKQQIDFYEASRIKTKFDKKIFFAVIALAVIVVFASLNFSGIFNEFAKMLTGKNGGSIQLDSVWQLLLSVFFFALIPAVCEELLFRGVIYNALRKKFGASLSVFISALVFMVIHFSIFQTVHQLILGVVLGYLVYFTGSIFYGIIFHFVNNILVLLLSYLPSIGAFFSFSNLGVLEIILSIIILIAGAVATVFFFIFLGKYTKKHKNYFNLEKSSKVIETSDKNENALAVSTRNLDTLYFVLTMAVCVILWIFNSFGG